MLVLWVICAISWGQAGTLAAVRGNIPGDVGTHDDSLNQQVQRDVDDPAPGAAHFEDCATLYPLLYWTNAVQDGIFPIKPASFTDHFDIYCDMTTDNGGWTVIQRRFDGSVNFDRNWADYKNGFGRPEGEYWLGLETIIKLTTTNNYELYVMLEDWEGNSSFAKYDTFSIDDETEDYKLHIGGYSGDAGDSNLNGKEFSTRDVDNDHTSMYVCGQKYSGGWWYGTTQCADSVLNGPYYKPENYHGIETGYGVWWRDWRGPYYSLKSTKIMMRPRNFTRYL